jgi:hypothetical protein
VQFLSEKCSVGVRKGNMEVWKGNRGSLCWKIVHKDCICDAAAVLLTVFPWKGEGGGLIVR